MVGDAADDFMPQPNQMLRCHEPSLIVVCRDSVKAKATHIAVYYDQRQAIPNNIGERIPVSPRGNKDHAIHLSILQNIGVQQFFGLIVFSVT
jgi:hypothetical protein